MLRHDVLDGLSPPLLDDGEALLVSCIAHHFPDGQELDADPVRPVAHQLAEAQT